MLFICSRGISFSIPYSVSKYWAIPLEIGWFEVLTRAKSRAGSKSSKNVALTTEGFPSVMVPVLSSAKTVLFAMVSRKVASLKSKPRLAAIPIPTSVAIGVASPNAQGQAMTITEMLMIRALSKLPSSIYHPVKVKRAMRRMITEKYPEMVLANCSICGFLVMDSSSSEMMEVSSEWEASLLAL